MKFKILSTFLIGLGAVLVFIWTPLPVWLIFGLFFSGSILGLAIIVKEKGAKKITLPLASWAISFISYILMGMDVKYGWSEEAWDSFRWMVPMVLAGIVAVVSTLVLMFKKPKTK